MTDKRKVFVIVQWRSESHPSCKAEQCGEGRMMMMIIMIRIIMIMMIIMIMVMIL